MAHDMAGTPIDDAMLVHNLRQIVRVEQHIALSGQVLPKAGGCPGCEGIAQVPGGNGHSLLEALNVVIARLPRPSGSGLVGKAGKPLFREGVDHTVHRGDGKPEKRRNLLADFALRRKVDNLSSAQDTGVRCMSNQALDLLLLLGGQGSDMFWWVHRLFLRGISGTVCVSAESSGNFKIIF
jgi:hypothetical protein